ncbi:MAG: ATP-binding protein [Nitrospinae bacterium]|nr:ATP-binding protein [Nitrospinota bacterium]
MEEDTLEISLVNDLREIASVAAMIDEFCAQRNYAPQIGYAINLSIEEILTNRISFGYDDDEQHRIEVIVRVEENQLVVVLVDNSAPFDLSATVEIDGEGSLEEGEELLAGLGLFLVNQVMDSVEYRRKNECNILIMTKETQEAVEADSEP